MHGGANGGCRGVAVVGIVDGCCRAVQGEADGGGRGVAVMGVVVGGGQFAIELGVHRGCRGLA